MGDWFYTVNGERLGPVPDAELRRLVADGTVTPESLLWTPGAAAWAPARRVKGLFPAAAAVPAVPAVGGPPGTLQYASTGTIEAAAAPVPFAPPPPDDGPFHRVGKNFRLGKQRWVGRVIVSPRAIYLWKVSRQNSSAYGVGGVIGMALATAAGRADDLTRSCDITELPEAVRREFDPKLKKVMSDVVILNRDALTLVKTSGGRTR